MSSRFVAIGSIKKSHGTNGEVLVDYFTRTSFRVGLKVWIVPPTENVHEVKIKRVAPRGDALLLTFEGIDSLNDSKNLNLKKILARRSDLSQAALAELEEDNEGPRDIFDYEVIDIAHGSLGRITEIIETPANDVIVVEGRFGEVLIAYHESVVRAIDDEQRQVEVEVLPNTIPVQK